ncbi:MAG: hypothetical protein A2Y97_12290 [Nitrospirae bacterium RBG_13_39_12]|nr:MAG: hypothetical protein A2Y97_12290 [Nitrospirae bacterium RBG_13_39_12]
MSNRKTLYIIGAGASSEAKLPTGYKLKEKIASLLNINFKGPFSQSSGDIYITEALRIYLKKPETTEKDINPYLHAARHIRDAMPQAMSIDNFIDTHNDNKKIELCGKLAIVRSILEAEKNSLLYIDDSNIYNKLNFTAIEKTWYANFMKLLIENCTKENLSKRLMSIALIVFNYDRCIEHFLYNSFQNYYGFKPDEAGRLVNEMEIYHPYGVVGCLPWQSCQDSQAIKYGENPYSEQLLNLASQIKTFTEGTDPNLSEILAIREKMVKADEIVFLGFAFHELNMKLMMPDSSEVDSTKAISFFGTAQGISDSDCDVIKKKLSKIYNNSKNIIKINNKLDCYRLFKEYWRSLSLNSL